MSQDPRILLVGMGGLGTPVAEILVQSGIRQLTIVDDDEIDLSNLHRQLLYREQHVGQSKIQTAKAALEKMGANVVAHETRLLPRNAHALIEEHDIVVEGADNLPTKFMTADACAQVGRPLVQAGVVRWHGWALAALPDAGACLRCLFEDLPQEHVASCAEAGVLGPVVGVVAALQASLVLRLIHQDPKVAGDLWTYDGLAGRIRHRELQPRKGCALCEQEIQDLRVDRYTPANCPL